MTTSRWIGWPILRALSLLAFSAAGGLAQQASAKPAWRGATIDGVVSDTALSPLENASISILGSEIRAVTGPNGRFRLTPLSPGSYVVFVRHLGFKLVSATVEIAGADTARLSFALQPAATTLATTVVTARNVSPRLAEFEERREFALKFGGGQFMSADEIDKRNTVFATELIRTFHGIQVGFSLTPGGGRGPIATTGRAAGSIHSTCYPAVWLDGVLLPGPVNLDGLPSPKEIAGIEVYPGSATVPLRYTAGGMSCGAILIWTR